MSKLINPLKMKLLLVILIMVPISLTANSGSFYGYSVHPDSWVSIQGTTNVNSFECTSESQMPRGFIMADPHPRNNIIYFSDAMLELDIVSFDCQNRRMNRDMQEALGADEHPQIRIRLLEAHYLKDKKDVQNDKLKVKVAIALNGVINNTEVIIDINKADGYQFLFTGSKELNMSDFNIDPPSPAMGIIKVRDSITINFNLLVEAVMVTQN